MNMNCRIVDLRNKEVINIKNGARLGYVSDVEVDTCDARLVAIIIYGRARFFGLLGREDDCVIDWWTASSSTARPADRAAAAGASCLKTSFAAFSGYD